jgi:hypothetical protein
MSYTLPQAQVFPEAQQLAVETLDPLRACIIGGNADLFRYAVASEKSQISLGAYNFALDEDYSFPGLPADSKIDGDYVRLIGDNVLLQYHEDLFGGGYGLVAPVSGYSNRIRSDTVAYIDNTLGTTLYPRHASLLDRDCQIGDIVDVRGTYMATQYSLRSAIAGFHGDIVAAIVAAATADAANETAQTVGCSVAKTGGADNCVAATCDASGYDGSVEGDIQETYTITVTQSSIGDDHTTALLRIRTASGNDDQDDVAPSAAGVATAIGDRGLEVTFSLDSGSSCSAAAGEDAVSPDDLIAGQVWTVQVTQDFTPPTTTSGGTYTGESDTTYIVTVTRGGEFTNPLPPQITVTTTTGVDLSGPTDVTGTGVAINVGTQGVTITFDVAVGVDRLRAGDIYYIGVTAAGEGSMQTIELQHNLPPELLLVADLELKLYIGKDGEEIPEQREDSAPLVNWEVGDLTVADPQFTVKAGITLNDETWTNAGVEVPLPMVEADLYLEYRAWICDAGDTVYEVAQVEDLDNVPGVDHPDNPLRYAIGKAWMNSNETAVKYIAVCDPDDIASWQAVLLKLNGRTDIYGLVPLTRDTDVLDEFQTHINEQSEPEVGRYRALWVNLDADEMVVISNEANSEDEAELLATVGDDPDVAGTQWTYVEIPAGNAQFLTNGARANDIMRYNFTTDGWGNVVYDEFITESIVNEDAFKLATGQGTAEETTAKKMELWRSPLVSELATQLAGKAAAYLDERVRCVWPDTIEDANYTLEGYHLCAALAGLRSGVGPQQGMTNLEIAGFVATPRSNDLFNRDEMDEMAGDGVWIVLTDEDGLQFTRHAVTSAGFGDLETQEEMIRTNKDSVAIGFNTDLAEFFGKTNVVTNTLELVRLRLEGRISYFMQVESPLLGGQLIDGEVLEVRQHSTLTDTVVVNMRLVYPSPFNNVEIFQEIVFG